MTHDEIISVLQHAKAGGKVEFRVRGDEDWELSIAPRFDFLRLEYRPYVEPPKPLELWVVVQNQKYIMSTWTTEKSANLQALEKNGSYCRMVQDGPLINPRKE